MNINTVRGRLWVALALLSLAVLAASTITWVALQRVDARLQALHQETLSQVAQALDLSKRSSDLATSAPYLLNQRSNFLIEQEGAKLLSVLESVQSDWPEASFTVEADKGAKVDTIIASMEFGVIDLVAASAALDRLQADLRDKIALLGAQREAATAARTAQDVDTDVRLNWWSLHSMTADALNASYAGNLIGVGEEQRHYQRERGVLAERDLTSQQTTFLTQLEAIVMGQFGVFELRRQELATNLDAQNALFRIRHDANRINLVASAYATQAEVFLADERAASSSTIAVTRLSVAAISIGSLGLALTAALFVSRYVTFNITRVSEAMVRLASGDRSSALPRKIGGSDEIGDLFRSFRIFRANALRLDRSNRQLDQRNALFEKVFSNISDGIAITDHAGRITARNPAFERILGHPKAGSPHIDLVEWLRSSRFEHAVEAKGVKRDHRGFLELTSDDGQSLEIRASKLPDDGRVWLISDATERRNMTDRLQQIDRIETLGKMAGDTAHDFANILSTIRTHAHLVRHGKTDGQNASLTAIESSVEYGTSLVERLLAFARKQNLAPELVELNTLVEGLVDLIEIGLKPEVALEISYADEELLVLVDPGQLESAILNLALNANNAIEGDGVINISLSKSSADEVTLSVQDTGRGMSDDVRLRAIEPFFTTRLKDGGTGLGLSIVYGFIKQTGGDFTIESHAGEGTTVTACLPLASAVPDAPSPRDGQRALVVEDDPKTRVSVVAILEDMGFETANFGQAKPALDALGAHDFDLIISDLELGANHDGRDILTLSAKSNPDAMNILMSGRYKTMENSPIFKFVEKPVTKAKLEALLSL